MSYEKENVKTLTHMLVIYVKRSEVDDRIVVRIIILVVYEIYVKIFVKENQTLVD